MSAFGGKADVIADPSACLLIAKSRTSGIMVMNLTRLSFPSIDIDDKGDDLILRQLDADRDP